MRLNPHLGIQHTVVSTVLCPEEMSKPVSRLLVILEDLRIANADRYDLRYWEVSVTL